MANKVLLFGKNGQVGWELQRSLAPIGQVLALCRNDEGGNLSNLSALKKVIDSYQPNIIINASAYTAVDKAEKELTIAEQINNTAVAYLAEQAKKLNSWFIHYSTDYVFDGTGQKPWLETDEVGPVNIYGKTKLAGEQAIQSIDGNYLIFRTSWVYGTYGHNFIKTILRLAREREVLSIIDDQIGAPTGAELIADITAGCIRQLKPENKGLYHVTASGETSWYGYANAIVNEANAILEEQLRVKEITPITTNAYPTPAKRPLNSRLDTKKIAATFDITLPHWQLGVKRVLTELLTK